MIITLTPNPSIDRAYDLTTLVPGEVNRSHASHVDAGGKGINVSRGLHLNGVETTAVMPYSGPDGDLLVSLLSAADISVLPVCGQGDTRSNITLVEESGSTTKINAPGPILTETTLNGILKTVADVLHAGDIVVGAGSLPAGAPDDLYVQLAQVAAAKGGQLVLDTSGTPLATAVAAGGLALIKPNEDELGELVGRTLHTVGEVVTAAREVINQGTEAVLVSLGANGALLVTATNTWWAGGPALIPASTVGAGDMTLAGYLSVPNADIPDRLKTAVAWGRAAVLLPGTAVPTPDLIDVASVRLVAEPDPSTPLKEL
ncbi:1-phosphofructokinase family hexose kinase [Jonesia quinghaiensis]|uniref:1-phosphofructokinase family hexose kinase n=1 Tax=Jonesia quinghaiensis TaxID=262806 RepID=UPI0004177FF9|nr:1-phosphofructokinase family hexose kinase [Jonesia quinghaiensis]